MNRWDDLTRSRSGGGGKNRDEFWNFTIDRETKITHQVTASKMEHLSKRNTFKMEHVPFFFLEKKWKGVPNVFIFKKKKKMEHVPFCEGVPFEQKMYTLRCSISISGNGTPFLEKKKWNTFKNTKLFLFFFPFDLEHLWGAHVQLEGVPFSKVFLFQGVPFFKGVPFSKVFLFQMCSFFKVCIFKGVHFSLTGNSFDVFVFFSLIIVMFCIFSLTTWFVYFKRKYLPFSHVFLDKHSVLCFQFWPLRFFFFQQRRLVGKSWFAQRKSMQFRNIYLLLTTMPVHTSSSQRFYKSEQEFNFHTHK